MIKPERKQSLGRGLSALLGESLPRHQETRINETVMMSIGVIKPGKYQPRTNFNDEKLTMLIDSVREKGIIQPLIVRPLNEEGTIYEIIAGERRWRAAKTLDLDEVPVIIRPCSDQEALETALIENIQRDDLNPVEEAEAYQRLLSEFGYTQEQLAKSIGKSRSHVANLLRLNTLPNHIKQMIESGKISAGHARALINADNIDEIAQNIVAKKLNVREVEKLTQKAKFEIAPNETDTQIALLEQQFSDLFGLKTSLKIRKSGGTLTVSFNSYEEIDDILEKLRGLKQS